jgi:tetratricopeptide (TPR) repeat protein
MRSAVRWPWFLATIVALGIIVAVGLLFREHLAVDHDAQAVREALASGRPATAAGSLRRWLKARPGSAEAHAMQAEVALADGDFPLLKREYNEARSLGYPDEKLDRIRAIWLARLGQLLEAEPILAHLWESSPKTDPGVDEALARIYLKTYRLRSAKAVIDRWIDDAPADGRPFLWLTEIDRRTEVDNPGSWERHFQEALKRDPDLDPARLGLAESLRKVHRNDEATREYEHYLGRHPDDPTALAGAGLNALEMRDLPRATHLLDRALELAPKNAAVLKGRAEVALYSGDLPAALRWLDQATQADPFDDGAFHVRARVRAMLGDASGSRADQAAFDRLKREQAELLALRTPLLDNPSDNLTRSKVVDWCFAHGREKDALDWAMAILAKDPNHAPTCRLLADYYRKQPDGAGLANFYRLKAATPSSTR